MIDNLPFPKYIDELLKLPRLNVDVTGFVVWGGVGAENGPNDIFSKIVLTNLYFRKVRKFIFLGTVHSKTRIGP